MQQINQGIHPTPIRTHGLGICTMYNTSADTTIALIAKYPPITSLCLTINNIRLEFNVGVIAGAPHQTACVVDGHGNYQHPYRSRTYEGSSDVTTGWLQCSEDCANKGSDITDI